MIYVVVLFGSLFGLCFILGVRVLLRNHKVRRLVRGMRKNMESSEKEGSLVETHVERQRQDTRISAIQAQEARTYLCKAEKALMQRRGEEAERFFIKALTVQPEAHEARAKLAKYYLTTDRNAKAEALYKELLQRTEDASFYANLGLAVFRQGKFTEACEAYSSALRRDPKNPQRHIALGRAHMAVHQYEDAVPLLEKAASVVSSRDPDILSILAECYEQLGNRERMEDTYQRLNKIRPYDEEVKKKLGALAST